jgi:hypothetical protein
MTEVKLVTVAATQQDLRVADPSTWGLLPNWTGFGEDSRAPGNCSAAGRARLELSWSPARDSGYPFCIRLWVS